MDFVVTSLKKHSFKTKTFVTGFGLAAAAAAGVRAGYPTVLPAHYG